MWVLEIIIKLSIIGAIAFLLRKKKNGIREMIFAVIFLGYSFFVKSPEVLVLPATILFLSGIFMYFKNNKKANIK